MIYTKSILKPRETSDGIRISIMSRHTLNDGVTPDSRINENSYDEWARVFAPPLKLIGDYYKRGLSWGDFERRYKKYLSSPEISSHVRNLASISLSENLTLLCI